MPKSLFENDNPKVHIIGILDHLSLLLVKKYGISIPKELKKQAVKEVLQHYKNHVDAYTVKVNGVDPYKFLSWFGLFFYEKALKQYDTDVTDAILKTTILAMNRALWEQGKTLPPVYLDKIFKMVKNDFNGKDNLGIGKNGLYLVFRSAALCEYRESDFTIEEIIEDE